MPSRRVFGGHLTESQDGQAPGSAGLSGDAPEFVPGHAPPQGRSQPKQPPPPAVLPAKSSAPDLPTRIHEDINNRQYDCVICMNEILRSSRVWSCSICWTVIHLHCVKKWHQNQTAKADQNQDPSKIPSWRCPGCNSSHEDPPGSYHCWCGKDVNPSSVPSLPAHSCGQTCSRPRPTCPHPCGLQCHAGPCPPCGLMGPSRPCFCGKHETSKRCTETDYSKGWSCNEICGDYLPCGEHQCEQPCHEGLCGSCELLIDSVCYCGKTRKEIPCSQREEIIQSFNHGQLKDQEETDKDTWFEGSFKCSSTCERPYDCGHHTCELECHPQDAEAPHCPLSPDVVLHCPCGKTELSEILPRPRQSCQDPIPSCKMMCEKVLPCGHTCLEQCGPGSCGPCTQTVELPCRCGRTTTEMLCHEAEKEAGFLECERTCRTQMSCGRHECGKQCCSGEKRASERLAAKRKNKTSNNSATQEDFEAEHVCLRTCGRQLKCGTHTCAQLCHRGPCPSCLEAIFSEITCNCGRTVLYPPQPCGTRPPDCRFECTRPTGCGHARVPHNCHGDDDSCPKCPFLVDRPCLCGKQILKNQPCWFEEVRCGLVCGKTLACGHRCSLPCHRPGQCETADTARTNCSQKCGKPRKNCEHVCLQQCHYPAVCNEDKPCQSKIFVTCECQNRKKEVLCLATLYEQQPREPLTCDDECLRLKRNRRLADALNIDPDSHSDDHIPYSETTLKLFRENVGWAQTQEREFRVFASDAAEKRLRFKPMKPNQRAFLHALAEDYGFDSESQDPEPHRHVSIFKTPRFVSAPRKTLGQCVNMLKIAAEAEAVARSSAAQQQAKTTALQPFNAFVLSKLTFGLTIDEVDKALAADLSSSNAMSLTFSTTFLPATDEVLVVAKPPPATAANITRSGVATTPVAVENALTSLKPAVSKTMTKTGLAGNVSLCHVDPTGIVVRREGHGSGGGPDASGWSAVAGRAAARPRTVAPPPAKKPGSVFLALGRKKPAAPEAPKAKKPEPEPVEDDWEAAVDKMEEPTEEAEAS
ncbi:hypothetical protein MCOR27_008729 [Pyricularia oryzae]|nr:hypothetical protein MCOR27_008729 [Pyricularia oryzae]KAI6333339.1 hypothetical protein MCOR28_010517 [Pyricularia oryzae]